MKRFPFFRQFDAMDCGPACLKMISAYYGKNISLQHLRERSFISKEGVSLAGIYTAAESMGYRCMVLQMATTTDLDEMSLMTAPLPCIIHWDQKHFVVLYKITEKYAWIADPGAGKVKIKIEKFKKFFESTEGTGIAILLEPTQNFYQEDFVKEPALNFRYLLGYFRPYRKFTIQMFVGILVSMVLQLLFPFLTQSIIDIGITNNNMNFIVLVLFAQLLLFLFSAAVNIMQRWILLHMNTRISVQLLYDFLLKLMKLPIPIFETKNIGDLYQRIEDNKRVEEFLSESFIPFILGLVNFTVFGIVLALYNGQIFLIYLGGLILYLIWLFAFLKKRKAIDYIRFQEASDSQTSVLELLKGMHEIKLQNSEMKRRQIWLSVQARLFKVKMKSLLITNYQDFGGQFINQFKDILIIIVCASEVVQGNMTLGMMLAVQYIIGQLNVPLQQLVEIIRSGQDAILSLYRMNELYSIKSETEELPEGAYHSIIPNTPDIIFKDVSFRYNELSEMVLKDINITIPHGKTTAIVGTSGSGKTTLLKLILGFYKPSAGQITIDNVDLSLINKSQWREKCGAIMQDGYIFSDTIANNIAESTDRVDKTMLFKAVKTANIKEFIESLPLGYNTQIGSKGNGVSSGQRQRLLIARAIYKDPDFLFFDEATNALDANNEKIIVDNLNEVTKDKTVLVIAHRLSTVKNADNIIVIDAGTIIEQGDHATLISKKGAYYNLVKNQLELGG